MVPVTRPYVVWSPPWDHKVGGIRALYRLVEELQARGLDAAVASGGADPEAIVVYPEIVPDNPLRAERIVRWRLAPGEVPEDGLTVDWLDYGADNPRLTLDLIDSELFARRPGPRSGVALWVHKGRADVDLIPPGAVQITSNTPERREDVAALLARSEYLVSFDEFSTVNVEAILLGTPVLLYPTVRFTREELLAQRWPYFGVAWSPDELPMARQCTTLAWDWYRGEQVKFAGMVDEFVRITQERWPTSG